MGSRGHGGKRSRRARRLVPAAAVAAAVAGVAGVLATRMARRPAEPAPGRPELPARRTARSGPRRLATRTPQQPVIDLDLATRALSGLVTDSGPAPDPTEREPVASEQVEHQPAEREPVAYEQVQPPPAERGPVEHAPAAVATASAPPSGRRRRRRHVRLMGAMAVVALGVGAGAALAGGEADDTPAPPSRSTPSSEQDTTTTLRPISATTAFTGAADSLVGAGSFTYSGTVSATDISHARPMLWLGVESTVTGEVSLDLGRVHEQAVSGDERVSETITSGPAVWGRQASDVADLATAGYEAVPELSTAEATPPLRGAALLPQWLGAAVSPSDLGTDLQGRRTFAAVLPAAALGPVERGTEPVDGRLTLTVDPDGSPVRVEVVTVSGPAFRLAIDITTVGNPVDIQLPGAPPV